MKVVTFNPTGGKLWVDIIMEGFYSISYSYALYDKDGKTVLTHPLKHGNNVSPTDDNYHIVNDNSTEEALAAYDGRIVNVFFSVFKAQDDYGYTLHVNILQGEDYASAQNIDRVLVQSNLGGQGAKDENVYIQLKKG